MNTVKKFTFGLNNIIDMNSRTEQLKAFDRLLTVMDDLRAKCPWDKKQTIRSLRHLTIEETYELGDAILDNDLQEVKKSWVICCYILSFMLR